MPICSNCHRILHWEKRKEIKNDDVLKPVGVNVGEKIEKKGKFSYFLVMGVARGKGKYPDATFEVHDDVVYPDGTREVRVSVTIEGLP